MGDGPAKGREGREPWPDPGAPQADFHHRGVGKKGHPQGPAGQTGSDHRLCRRDRPGQRRPSPLPDTGQPQAGQSDDFETAARAAARRSGADTVFGPESQSGSRSRRFENISKSERQDDRGNPTGGAFTGRLIHAMRGSECAVPSPPGVETCLRPPPPDVITIFSILFPT